MKNIGKVKLTMNKEMVVNVNADVHMKDMEDKDDLYFVLFNIMAEPLRLSLGVVGNFFEELEKLAGSDPVKLAKLLETDPDIYLRLVQTHYADLVHSSNEEKVKVVLDNQRNADMARMVLSSLLQNKYYTQVTTYHIPGEQPIVKEQKVPTDTLSAELKVMLDITKNWDGFDLDEYVASMSNRSV